MDWKCCFLLYMWKLSFSLSHPRCMLTIKILILGHMPHQTNYLCKFAFNIWFPTDGRMQNYKAKIWKMLLIKAALNFNKKASNRLQSVFDGDVVKNSHHFSFIRIFDKKIAYILQAQKITILNTKFPSMLFLVCFLRILSIYLNWNDTSDHNLDKVLPVAASCKKHSS